MMRIKLIRRFFIVLIWILIWQTASMLTGLELLLASPVTVLGTLFEMLTTWDFYKTLLHSLCNIGGGFFIGLAIGIILGMLAGKIKIFEEFIALPLQLMKSLPVAAFVILLLMWFGSKKVSTIITAMVVIPMITNGVREGIRNTDRKLMEFAKVYRMKKINQVRYIFFPESYPYVVSQLKMSLGMCFKAGISAEVIGLVSNTIGTSMYYAKIYLLSAELFAWSLVVIVVSALFEKIVLALSKGLYLLLSR